MSGVEKAIIKWLTAQCTCRNGGSNKKPRRRKAAESEEEESESEAEEADDDSSMAELPSPQAPALPPSPPASSPGEYSQCERLSDFDLLDTVIAPAKLHTFFGARVQSCASTSKAWKRGLLLLLSAGAHATRQQ